MPQFNDPPTHVDWFSQGDPYLPQSDPYLPENRGDEISELIRREDPHQTYDCLFMKDFASTRKINLNRFNSDSDEFLKVVGNDENQVLPYDEELTLEEMGYETFDSGAIIYTSEGQDERHSVSPLLTLESAIYFDRIDFKDDIPYADKYSEKMLFALWFYGITTGNTYLLDSTGNSAIDDIFNPYTTSDIPRYIEIPLFEKGITYFSYYVVGGDLVKKRIPVTKSFTYKFDTQDVFMYSVVVSGANSDIAESLLSGTKMLYSSIEDFNPNINDDNFIYVSKKEKPIKRTPEVVQLPTEYFTFAYVTRALWRRRSVSFGNDSPITLFSDAESESSLIFVSQPVYYLDFSERNSLPIEGSYYGEELQLGNNSDNATHSVSKTKVIYTTETAEEVIDLTLYAKAITLVYAGSPVTYLGYELNPYIEAESDDLITYLDQLPTILTEEEYDEVKIKIYDSIAWLPTDDDTITADIIGNPESTPIPLTTTRNFAIEDTSPFGQIVSSFQGEFTIEGYITQTLTAQQASDLNAQYNTLPAGANARADLPFTEGQEVGRVKIPNYELVKLQDNVNSSSSTDNYPETIWEFVNTPILKKVPLLDYRKGVDIVNWAWTEEEDEITRQIKKELYREMPDSLRVKEIHLALEAEKFATYVSSDSGEPVARTANVGQYVELIAVALGINMLADGTPYKPKEPIRQSLVDDDPDNTVNVDAGYRFGFWGAIEREPVTEDQITFGEDVLQTDAPMEVDETRLVYEAFSNEFKLDESTGEATSIEPSGLMLVHNLPQLYRQILDDFDKALGLQESAAFALRSAEDIQVPDPNNSTQTVFANKICTYEGLHSLVAEIAYMLSEISRRSSGAQVSSMINTALLYELMGIMGLPVEPKSFKAKIGIEEDTGEDIKSDIYHPAFSDNAPRLFELWTILMQNIAPLLGDKFTLSEENIQAIRNANPDELQDIIDEIKQEISG